MQGTTKQPITSRYLLGISSAFRPNSVDQQAAILKYAVTMAS
jgi:hypothetical protein